MAQTSWELSPITKIVPSVFNCLSRFVSGIDFRMNDVRISKSDCDEVVHMGWEAFETSFISQKPMDINNKQSALFRGRLCRNEGLG